MGRRKLLSFTEGKMKKNLMSIGEIMDEREESGEYLQ